MKSMQRMLAAGALALGALGSAGMAQARDVYWSVGVGSPGVAIGVGNAPPAYYAPPVYMQPAPVYVQPRPVYVQPHPVYMQPPAYYGPPRGYRPARYYYGPPGHHKHYKKSRHRHRHWDD